MPTIQEGLATITTSNPKIVSKAMPVFYNPIMKFNRDVSILLLNSVNDKALAIADPLAGSGIRSIRMLKELPKNKIQSITINDASPEACKHIRKHLKKNKVKAQVTNEDANLFLLNSKGFNYIDIDPFGSPNPFLQSAVIRIARNGILAVTATDTAALAGTYPKACQRKYWAKPLRTAEMHEVGLRILIRKVQLVAAQFQKALIPMYSYSKDHYMRVFFRAEKSKEAVDKILKQHDDYKEAGPMWTGNLQDVKLAKTIASTNKDDTIQDFLDLIAKELPILGFYDIHALAKTHKLKALPKTEDLIKAIKKTHKATKTHFAQASIKSSITEPQLIKLLNSTHLKN
jgi:tRNA (guanine26-N2/guanine27-N2)-dimethyltransferase|tara:strand:+ start:14 stop:1045 length:1032 start_codon:yes stop_codon:yes gene_type:complete